MPPFQRGNQLVASELDKGERQPYCTSDTQSGYLHGGVHEGFGTTGGNFRDNGRWSVT